MASQELVVRAVLRYIVKMETAGVPDALNSGV